MAALAFSSFMRTRASFGMLVCGWLALAALPVAMAGSALDPEVVDVAGDANVQGVGLPAGLEWADLRAAWLAVEEDLLVLRIAVASAPSQPLLGEVAAHLSIDGAHFHAGWTTVLPPFALPFYQGGFYCPASEDGAVDPATCDLLSDVGVGADVFTVPLPADVFGWVPGSVVVLHRVYADAWYLDAQVVLDETGAGRAFVLPGGNRTAEAGTGSGDAPPALEPSVAAADVEDEAPDMPVERSTREGGAGVMPLVSGALALAALGRSRLVWPARRPGSRA